MKWVVAIGIGAGAALIYLLSQASANTALFTRHYAWLFALCAIVSLALMVLIGYQVAALVKKLRNHAFGALLTVRLAAVFVLMALIPGVLLYALSVQFLDRSIESWFEVRVDKALEAGLNLGRAALDQNLRELGIRIETVAAELPATDATAADLNAFRTRSRLETLALFDLQGIVVAASGQPVTEAQALLALTASRERIAQRVKEELPEQGLALRVATLVPTPGNQAGRILLAEQKLAPEAIAEALRIEAGYRDYQELSLFRAGLKRLFALTLTLAMLLTLFSAIAASFVLSERISAPMAALADATRAVAAGDYSRFNPVLSHDEFGVLTQSFNTMTQRIADATEATHRQQRALAATNTYLEGILANLTSGVLTFDRRFRLRKVNDAAARILEAPLARLAETPVRDWPPLAPAATPLVEVILRELGTSRVHWERQVTLVLSAGERTLFVRGTRLQEEAPALPAPAGELPLDPGTDEIPAADGGRVAGYVVVFDDITQLKEAERSAAWGEVARRLAHEIKNPLTPIQLSAERLEHKLASKLDDPDAQMLKRATGTIVAQVGALKAMVDDFGQYAKATAPRFTQVDAVALLREVLALYEAMPAHLQVDLPADVCWLEADAALLRQLLHNLLQNAQDALIGVADPAIRLHLLCGGDRLQLRVTDNGCGIPPAVLPRIFEPYVTTKAKGTGLGLAIVRRIVDLHHGEIQLRNESPTGVRVQIDLPLRQPQGTQAAGSPTSSAGML
jgi:nitrogen fixation/metabolism regulation signal transduction histidine kinase